MNDIHEKSLALIDELFENISDEEFLTKYNAVEKGIGPLVSEFLGASIGDKYELLQPVSFDLLIDGLHYIQLFQSGTNEDKASFQSAANDCPYSMAA